MRCKIIRIKDDAKTIPRFEDFENSTELNWDTIDQILNYHITVNELAWILILEENSLYRVYLDHIYSFFGKLKPSEKNSSLTFETLRKANIQRLPEFKNSKGLPAHSKEDGSDWSPAQWLQAVIGELGEYANVLKKVERGDLTFEEAKPLIEKELADVQTYLDLLAFRVDVDLSKAVEQKFNEVSERVGCSLRIENNEVVRKLPQISKQEILASRTMEVEDTEEDLQDELAKIKENIRARIQSGRTKCGTSIFKNYDYNPKTMEINTNTEQTITYPTGVVTKIINQYSNGTTIAISNLNVEIDEDSKPEIKNTAKPKMTDEEFKAAKEACKIPRQELFLKKLPYSDIGDLMNQMFRFKLFNAYANVYPLQIPRDQITDVYSFDFQGLDDGKQYLFYSVKKLNCPIFNTRRTVCKNWLFDFFSKQLGTKIVGMLINGHKENKIINPNDTVQFYDERNVLWNFRLVKSSDKNVEVSAT